MTRALVERLQALPKVLLHEHLDGGLRPATLLELLRARGMDAPVQNASALVDWFSARAQAGSLAEYLRGFALTVAAMASPAALARVAFEAAEDARLDGCVLAEFRIAPTLFEPFGLPPEAAVESLLTGLRQCPLPSGLILCAMRDQPSTQSERVVSLALRYRDQGVVGFDLAGAERGHPPSRHVTAFAMAREASLPITCHAGEADVAERVLEAVRLGARRIGHGVRMADTLGAKVGSAARATFDEVCASGVHLELCPTSNIHTGAAASVAAHPIRRLWQTGLSVSFHTDNRLISGVSMSGEAMGLLCENGLSLHDLAAMSLQAAAHSFLPAPAREKAQAAVQAWQRASGERS
ncbi:adenosine deaminase family protein [Variovorax sp. J22R133]|uniref:adenosine deaminase family protein n=1 Tax=Variovorax brevis TaxID=3053503 RepID=UPI002575B4AC|nr:adenosine deaminase family protein [Variovorax sp. J22R133]MDM0116612.1 adenosine deaminase family protein [Variovorax sp. J22R133]